MRNAAETFYTWAIDSVSMWTEISRKPDDYDPCLEGETLVLAKTSYTQARKRVRWHEGNIIIEKRG